MSKQKLDKYLSDYWMDFTVIDCYDLEDAKIIKAELEKEKLEEEKAYELAEIEKRFAKMSEAEEEAKKIAIEARNVKKVENGVKKYTSDDEYSGNECIDDDDDEYRYEEEECEELERREDDYYDRQTCIEDQDSFYPYR